MIRVLARPYLMTLYVIFPIHLNFPIRSRCVYKAIIHRKKLWIVLLFQGLAIGLCHVCTYPYIYWYSHDFRRKYVNMYAHFFQ